MDIWISVCGRFPGVCAGAGYAYICPLFERRVGPGNPILRWKGFPKEVSLYSSYRDYSLTSLIIICSRILTPGPWLVQVIRVVPLTLNHNKITPSRSFGIPQKTHCYAIDIGALGLVQKSSLIGNSSLLIRGARPSFHCVRSRVRNESFLESQTHAYSLPQFVSRSRSLVSLYLFAPQPSLIHTYTIHASFIQIVSSMLYLPACEHSWNGTGLATLVNLRRSSFEVMERL